MKPAYALLSCLAEEIGAEPIALVASSKRSFRTDGFGVRCIKINCPNRPQSTQDDIELRLDQNQTLNPLEEISTDDRVDLLGMMDAESEK